MIPLRTLVIVVALVAVNLAAVAVLRLKIDRDVSQAADRASSSTPFPFDSTAPAQSSQANPIRGPLQIAGAPDGSILRATLGSCADDPATVWVAAGDAALQRITIRDLRRVVNVSATPTGWSIVGQDAKCRAAEWTTTSHSSNAFRKGRVSATGWVPQADNAEELIYAGQPVLLGQGCLFQQMQVRVGRPLVLCQDGRLMTYDATTETFVVLGGSLPTAGFAMTGPRSFLVLRGDNTCTAFIGWVTPKGEQKAHCFEGQGAPLGLTVAAGKPVAQVGFDLWVNTGRGTWQKR